MAAKPVVFVIGATGHIGAATVSALSAKYADKLDIRAGARNLEKADKLKLPGVTVVQADMGGDRGKLKETLTGVDALFIVTPGAENRVALTVGTAEVAKEAGVKFLLAVGLSTRTGTIEKMALGRQLEEIEDKISKLGIPHCFIGLPFFLENNWGLKDSIQSQSAIYGPLLPDKPNAVVAVEDAGKAAATVLSDYSKHAGKTYLIISDSHNQTELASAFSDILGKEVKYVQVPYEAIKQGLIDAGLPDWQVDGLLETFHLIDSGAPEMNPTDNGDFKTLTGEEPTTLKAWITKYAAAFK